MKLLKQTHSFGSKKLEVWLVYVAGDVWVRAIDVCKFLEYSDSDVTRALLTKVTNPNQKKTFEELTNEEPPEMLGKQTVFVNKMGLARLMLQSKSQEVQAIYDWMYEKVIPSFKKLCEAPTGKNEILKQLLEANQALIVAREDAERARTEAIILAKEIIDLAKSIVSNNS